MGASIAIGAPFPDYQVETPEGTYISLSELLKGAKTALVLIVGEWNPYCQAQMTDLVFHKDEIEEQAGGRVVVLSVDAPEKMTQFKEQMGFDFPVYSDQRWQGLQVGGLKDSEDNLYNPSVFVCDAEGVVRWFKIGKHYADRASYKEIMEALAAA